MPYIPARPISADLAVSLYQKLKEARDSQLHPALSRAIGFVGVEAIDADLKQFVPAGSLTILAKLSIRGEWVFPTPCILRHNPRLIGYYRMLLGQSLKEFSRQGYGAWTVAESSGIIGKSILITLDDFCAALIAPLAILVGAMGEFKTADLNDLALLTLGPTLQGGRNNVIGRGASLAIFESFCEIVSEWIVTKEPKRIRLKTSAGEFEIIEGSDPDILIRQVEEKSTKPLAAIEIKGGSDASNAHNRVGEAEKSHVKAREAGYVHRWTLIVIGKVHRTELVRGTPSTTMLLDAEQIIARSGPDWVMLTAELRSLLLKTPKKRVGK